MKSFFAFLSVTILITGLAAGAVIAGTDEYMGDAAIYAGVPTTVSRPNVMIVIDNSRATLNYAPGEAYNSAVLYPQGTDCAGVSSPADQCYLPYYIYSIDNQGDIANQAVLANDNETLENLTCTNNNEVIRQTLQQRGTYSGAGTTDYPNIRAGACDIGPTGAVYVLGNYLNYTMTSGYYEDPCANVAPAPIVKAYEYKSGVWNTRKYGFFQLAETHTSSGNPEDTPYNYKTSSDINNWLEIAPDPEPENYTVWQIGTSYEVEECTPPEGTDTPMTQRESFFTALEAAIGSAVGAVNFGAMTYGVNNSGGKLLHDMTTLAYNSTTVYNSATCAGGANPSNPYCQFLATLPGPGENDGEPVLASNTGRPQAESVFDAGYYFGANYSPVNNIGRIPQDMENVCDLNHIILLTNGFTNGDDSPNMDVVGDADSDNYPDENVYGLGSHWLDDVAKYLNYNDKITTHTILAFQDKDSLIENAAKDGDGKFFNVYNHEELAAALTELLATIINEKSTSFVAPVVPASTTNRTISSNNVYLGLFRPQQTGPWYGNVKKYGINLENLQLLGYDGSGATDAYGDFDRDSISYWSLNSNGLIPSSDGYIDPDNIDPNDPNGDGGRVDAGGAGGVLLERVKGLAAAIAAAGNWETASSQWRRIYTLVDASAEIYESENHFLPDTSIMNTWGNNNITASTLGVSSDVEKNALIKYIHGFAYEELDLPGQAEARDWIMGDILHSRPVVFNYTRYTSLQENTCYENLTPDQQNNGDAYNSSVIFAGSNDGMLHAFRDCDGKELWAFIPPNVLDSLQYMKDPEDGHASFVDSAPSLFVHDKNEDGYIDQTDDKVVLVIGQRRGGGSNILDTSSSRGSYYALDVTNPSQPKFLWELDNLGLGELGETWSQPRLAKVKVDANNFKLVAFVGAGYDQNEDLRYGQTQDFPDSSNDGFGNPIDINKAPAGGTVDGLGSPQISAASYAITKSAANRSNPRGRGLLAIEVAHLQRTDSASPFVPSITGGTVGTVFWSYTPSGYNGSEPVFSFASDLTVLDMNSDSYADTIYVGDTGGNLWRFKVDGATPSNWTGTILFESNPGADNSTGRKIFYKPTVAMVGAPHIYFGTGDRAHPLNISTEDRMYCVVDWGADGTYPISEAALEDVTLNTIQKTDTSAADAQAIYDRLYSMPSAPYNENGDFTYGWYIKLDGTDRAVNGDPGEKVLAQPTVFNGEVFFSTYQLYIGPYSGCEGGNLGISRLYHLNYKTGEAVMNYDVSNDLNVNEIFDGDGNALVNERAIGEGEGEILQRTDRVRVLGEGIPSGIVTIIDASGRVTQLISSSDRVEASGMTDIKLISPVYWMQW